MVTLTGPAVAVAGTAARMALSDRTVNAVSLPLNATAEAKPRPVPLTMMLLPIGAAGGDRPTIVGVGITVNLLLVTTTPAGVVRVTVPLAAPAGTIAVTLRPLCLL